MVRTLYFNNIQICHRNSKIQETSCIGQLLISFKISPFFKDFFKIFMIFIGTIWDDLPFISLNCNIEPSYKCTFGMLILTLVVLLIYSLVNKLVWVNKIFIHQILKQIFSCFVPNKPVYLIVSLGVIQSAVIYSGVIVTFL